MLESVRTLGASLSEKPSLMDYLSVAKLKKTRKVLGIIVDRNSYMQISVEDKKNDRESLMKYLYAKGSANGPDRTPSSLIVEPEKTLKKKIIPWFDKHSQEDLELENIGKILKSNTDRIVQDVIKEFSSIAAEERMNILLTVKVKTGGIKFVGELDSVRKILTNHFKVADSEPLGLCYFCNEKRPLIKEKPKLSEIFSFSTFDKKGFLYGFNPDAGSRQMPVCIDCYMHLKKGKEWLDKYAFFNFEGYKYYTTPEVWGWSETESFSELLDNFKTGAEQYASRQNKSSKNLTYHNNLMQEEDDWLEIMASKNVSFGLNFMFVSLKGGGKYMDIEEIIEDVPITRIRKIIEAFNQTLENKIFKEENMRSIIGKKWEGNLAEKKGMYLAAIVKSFFPTDSRGIKFLEMIHRILSGIKIDEDDLFRSFMMPIRSEFHKNWTGSKMGAVKSLVFFMTMKKLMLITDRQLLSEGMEKADDESLLSLLDSPSKKAIYLEGVLVGKLLTIQYARRKASPFFDRLRGLNITFQYAKNLFPEIINKLREYQQAYTDLEKDVAIQFMLSEKTKSTLSDDEASYYFTLGLVLHSSLH